MHEWNEQTHAWTGCCIKTDQKEYSMMGGLGMGFGIFGLVLMVLFWGGLIALAVWLVRSLFPHTTQPPAPSWGSGLSARDILDRRFARGEINLEEYNLMKASMSDESE